MNYDPDIHHRHSIRLKEFDYSKSGAYFTTIVTQNRLPLFGEIDNGCCCPNNFGNIVNNEWSRLPQRFPGMDIDYSIVMPNHFHGIIILTDCNPGSNIASILGSYKSSTSRMINAIRKTPGQSVWQRNYYEHIIRNETYLNRIREYILYNPENWLQDDEFII
jgi:putative transposase